MAESHQVLLVSFTDRQASRAAYQEALALPGLRQAVVVERSPEGLLDVPETHVEGAGRLTEGGGAAEGLLGTSLKASFEVQLHVEAVSTSSRGPQ